MRLCPNAMSATMSMLERAESYASNWIAIRASFGMNGIFMRSSDLAFFADYLIEHQARRPPDHLVRSFSELPLDRLRNVQSMVYFEITHQNTLQVVEWFAGETKQSAAYKVNS